MVDRHYFGDLAFAVLLVLPLVGLARIQPVLHHQTVQPAALSAASVDRSPDGRISLLG
ncbi:MAG: hypothetical protein ACJ8FT_06825 [Sphingomonas sp.]